MARELERAGQALQAAILLHQGHLNADALSRSYYAVAHAAKAMLLSEAVTVASHEAIKRLFGLHFVKTKKIDSHFADILRWEQDDRILADYDVAFVPAEELARVRIEDARKFVNMATAFLKDLTTI
jgi:uncharacterized protein (UPF0332 family)